MKIDEIKLLYGYNDWADALLLGACARVSPEQYAAPDSYGRGGLRPTMVHILDNIWQQRITLQGYYQEPLAAFVCGEETALIASIMGMRGDPHPRPPFPSVKGVWDKPSNNNNVETYSNVPQIILNGAAWYASMGTEKSKGTKTFAVGGNVVKPGLIEVPMGITLHEIIFDVAGGVKDGHKFKAVQTGGPMGGCLTEEHLDLELDYEALTRAGSMMGSGGLVVMDETSCMVDIARFFMDLTQAESCGKCTPCRVGTRRILEMLQKISDGKGEEGDIEKLEDLCYEVK